MSDVFHALVLDFANGVAKKTAGGAGQPEGQLRGPFETLLVAAGHLWNLDVVCIDETPLSHGIGRPDFAVQLEGLVVGHAELKPPGRGALKERFSGHDLDQFERLSVLPNLLYTDGNEWVLYRYGEPVSSPVRFTDDIRDRGENAACRRDAQSLELVLRGFLDWQPILPTTAQGEIDLARFADELAPLCRLLRDEVRDALKDDSGGPLRNVQRDWRQLLFPDASDAEFADAYAQTVTFALLLARTLGAEPLSFESARQALGAQHSLLSQAMLVLTDGPCSEALMLPFSLLIRLISALPATSPTANSDPWLYFYEDFLAAYDPQLREQSGVYFTPLEVVRSQVRLVDDLLVNRLGRELGLADPEVATLDPAAGTGTYLFAIIDHTLNRLRSRYGPGSLPENASALAHNLHAFESLVSAYAVADLRVSNALTSTGGRLPPRGARVYLADTLESPNATPRQMPTIVSAIAEQRERALEIKKLQPILVCIGNPPYDRHAASTDGNQSQTGGWVRWGEDGDDNAPLLEDFVAPARGETGGQLNNIYNLYVYFWRWGDCPVFC